eukprot:TRINITY_DN12502_c0_g1_i2.p1 TRINITY_DN12502_c0_g1~~TRINITY_DN12502_c0_g1_i2.p1  ORF type:complete len:139 (+),score=21.91 TRINITY_DN12502_c0_g1_i2:440-856(+)
MIRSFKNLKRFSLNILQALDQIYDLDIEFVQYLDLRQSSLTLEELLLKFGRVSGSISISSFYPNLDKLTLDFYVDIMNVEINLPDYAYSLLELELTLRLGDGEEESYCQRIQYILDSISYLCVPVSYTHLTLPTIYSV